MPVPDRPVTVGRFLRSYRLAAHALTGLILVNSVIQFLLNSSITYSFGNPAASRTVPTRARVAFAALKRFHPFIT